MEIRTKNLTDEMKQAGRQAEETASDIASCAREARAAAMESARSSYNAARRTVAAGAKATDAAIHDSPYCSMGLAFGMGLLMGILIKRR